MMKKTVFLGAALAGALLSAGSVMAASFDAYYELDTPSEVKIQVAVSGACSGKYELPVSYAGIDRYYTNNVEPKAIDVDNTYYGVYAYGSVEKPAGSGNFVGYGLDSGSGYANSGKMTEKLVKDKTRVISVQGSDGSFDVSGILKAAADGAITCKDGKSLMDHMRDGSIDSERKGWSVKGSGSVSSETANLVKGVASGKVAASASLLVKENCVVKKGDITDTLTQAEGYQLSCSPGKGIKVKATVSFKKAAATLD